MKKLDSLTALRFFAAASIVVEHSHGGFVSMRWIPHYHYDFGVSFFFVLSGFILCYTYGNFDCAVGVREFYIARIARIWPLHLLMLCIYLLSTPSASWFWGGTNGYHAAILLSNIFLIHAWIPAIAFFFGFNAVSWSISAEAFFYLIFPILRHNWDETWQKKSLLLIFVALLILLITTVCRVTLIDNQRPLAISAEGVGYISPFVRIIEFVLGMLAAKVFRAIQQRELPKSSLMWTALEIGGVALVVLIDRLAGYKPTSPWTVFCVECPAAPAFLLLIVIFAFGNGLISKVISVRPLVILGEASFALYLSHQFIFGEFYNRRSFFGVSDPILCVGYWVTVMIVALLLWRFFEAPARNWIRTRGGRQSIRSSEIT